MTLENSQEVELSDEFSIVECSIALRIGFPNQPSANSAYDQYIAQNYDVSPVAEDEDGWFLGLNCDLGKIAEVQSQLDEVNQIAQQFGGEPLDPEDLVDLQHNPCIQSLSLVAGLAAYENGEYESAIAQLTQLMDDGIAEPAEYLGVVGLAYLKLEDFEGARKTFEDHLALDLDADERSTTACNLATSLFRLNKFEEAEKQYIAALNSPKHGYACYGMACLRCRENNVEETFDWLEKAVQVERSLKIEASTDDDFANVVHDPRFTELTRVGIWDRLMISLGK